jgi:hypothetical protein
VAGQAAAQSSRTGFESARTSITACRFTRRWWNCFAFDSEIEGTSAGRTSIRVSRAERPFDRADATERTRRRTCSSARMHESQRCTMCHKALGRHRTDRRGMGSSGSSLSVHGSNGRCSASDEELSGTLSRRCICCGVSFCHRTTVGTEDHGSAWAYIPDGKAEIGAERTVLVGMTPAQQYSGCGIHGGAVQVARIHGRTLRWCRGVQNTRRRDRIGCMVVSTYGRSEFRLRIQG